MKETIFGANMTSHACIYTKVYTLELQHQKNFLISEFSFFSI